jgi:PAS domain S-box-containing protein
MPSRVFLSSIVAEPKERRLASTFAIASLLMFAAAAPFARVQLPEEWTFIPIYETALAVCDLITAVILIIQLRIARSRAVLVLAAGYLINAFLIIPHALSFPGLFSPTGLLGAGPQTTVWLYIFWHGLFPLSVLGYALLKSRANDTAPWRLPIGTVVVLIVVAAAIVAAAATLVATVGHDHLPALMHGGQHSSLTLVVAPVWGLCLFALFALWRQRPQTVLDIWLMVVIGVWVFDITLSAVLNAGRFDVGFYVGRIYGFSAATFVLVVLLGETGALYAKLARLLETEQEARRTEAEERRYLFESSLDLIIVVDRAGHLQQVSPSATTILGHAPSEMLGRNVAEYVDPDDLDAVRNNMRQARHGELIRDIAIRYRHKNGRVVTLAWSGMWSEDKQRHFLIGRDVTKQKRTERMKDEFIATVSHELRTPVTTIAAPLGLLMSGAAGTLPDPVQRLVAIAQNNTRRLVRLVNDILDIENIESGAVLFNLRQVDLMPLVEQAIEANRPLAEECGVPVRLDPNAPDAVVYTDTARLSQVLANLLSNAVKFSRRGEQADVSIEMRGEHARIAIRDHGPGIPDDFRTFLFEKFAQVDATDTRQRGGAGLGLSIVKQAMTRLGGSVGYSPVASGGSIFYVDVPLTLAAPTPRPMLNQANAQTNANVA